MPRRIFISLFLALAVSGLAAAHGPGAISAAYDGISQILTVTVSHPVSNPKEHYINSVRINLNGEDVLQQSFDRQFDNKKQLAKVFLPGVKDGATLKVKAGCNKYGDKEEKIVLALPGYTDVTPAQAQVLIEEISDLVIIDVSPHYAEGHLPGAEHYHLPELQDRLEELDKSRTHLVYCHADGPSRSGAQTLADNGFAKVYRLEGNYNAWVKAGYRTEK